MQELLKEKVAQHAQNAIEQAVRHELRYNCPQGKTIDDYNFKVILKDFDVIVEVKQ